MVALFTTVRHARWLHIAAQVLAAIALCAVVTAGPQAPMSRPDAYENLTVDVLGVKATITYDLLAPPTLGDVYNVSLGVRMKGSGETVRVNPSSLAGDVGRFLIHGKQKRIVWEAGSDVEVPLFDLYEYYLVVVAEPPTGTLDIESTPTSAEVLVDGVSRGAAPLRNLEVKTGPHVVIFRKAGYLENRQMPDVQLGKSTLVKVALNENPAQRPPVTPSGPTAPPKGGLPKWLLPAAGGGAAAAALGLKGGGGGGGGGTDTACTFTLSPTSWSPSQAGGTQPVAVNVTPVGCSPQSWTAVSNNPSFLTVSPGSGSGSGSVTLTLLPNTPDLGVASRNGSATIAGQTFAITGQTNQITVFGFTSASAASGSAFYAAVSGVTVVAGQKLTISASGQIQMSGIGLVGPGGHAPSGNVGAQGRLPGSPAYGLVCGIADTQQFGDSNTFFFVGGTTYTITSPVLSGNLVCGMNAPDAITGYSGHTGQWSLTITIGGS